MFEYQAGDVEPISELEATAMLAGIVVDTQSFTVRTGTRTFDAASYLRSSGADVDQVSYFLKENRDNYLAEIHLISLVDFLSDQIAIITAEVDRNYDAVTAAKAVDSLLSVNQVEASFIVYQRTNDKIGISARSNGKINVQLIMEELGGGGHLTAGATQLADKDITAARTELVAAIKKQTEAATEV